MKRIIAITATLFATSAFAVDVTTSMVVTGPDGVKYESVNKFAGMSDKEAKAMRKRGDAVLSLASALQDKKGPYTITFTWNDEPAVETQGLKLNGVNKVVRAGNKWLSDTIAEAEAHDRAKRSKPWGN